VFQAAGNSRAGPANETPPTGFRSRIWIKNKQLKFRRWRERGRTPEVAAGGGIPEIKVLGGAGGPKSNQHQGVNKFVLLSSKHSADAKWKYSSPDIGIVDSFEN